MLRMPTSTSLTFKKIKAVAVLNIESNVVDADYFAAIDVDDLLIEQVAPNAEHVLIRMVGGTASRRSDECRREKCGKPDRSEQKAK